MTTIIKQHTNDNYYITMEWDKNNIYIVQVCPKLYNGFCSYPIKEITYTINEKEKANNTFKRYVKKYI